MTCPLSGYPKGFRCGGGWNAHHILRRSLGTKTSKQLKKMLDDYSLRMLICMNHNISRWADTPYARAVLLDKKNRATKGRTRKMVEQLPWDNPHEDMSWRALTEVERDD